MTTKEETIIEILNIQREYKHFTNKYKALEDAKESLLYRIDRQITRNAFNSTFRCPSCYRDNIERHTAICPYCGQFLKWE